VGEANWDLAEKDCASIALKPPTNSRVDRHWVEISYHTRTKTHKKNQEEKPSLEPRKLGAREESCVNEFPGGS
jgi:hypothetical protein